MNKRKRFGEILVEAGVLTEPSLRKALAKQKGTDKPLGQVLEEMGIVSQKDIAVTLARQFGYRTVSGIARHTFPPEVLRTVTESEALKKLIFPLRVQDKVLYLAMVNPLDMGTLDAIAFRTRLRVVPCVTTPDEIREAVRCHYLTSDTEAEEPTLPVSGFGNRWSILVVDDHEMVRSAVSAALWREGFDLRDAADGAEGLKLAYQNPPHLVLTDLIMPRMDGYELFRALQSHPPTSHIPVIAFSSKSTAEEEARALDTGFFDFVPKPVNPTRLLARVKRALRIAYGERSLGGR